MVEQTALNMACLSNINRTNSTQLAYLWSKSTQHNCFLSGIDIFFPIWYKQTFCHLDDSYCKQAIKAIKAIKAF